MEEVVSLQEVDTFVPKKSGEALLYPSVIIQGITTEEEVLYFHNKFSDSSRSVPLFIFFEGVYKRIGSFELSLDNLLVIRSVAKYQLKLMISEAKEVNIDLDNPEALLSFIKIVD